jgi:hypothetical protein
MNKVHEKLKLNPGLIAALESFAGPEPITRDSSMMATERLYVHRAPGRAAVPWTVSRACGMALDILATEELMRLKFLALRDGMKHYGMDGMYERIMGEPIDAGQP